MCRLACFPPNFPQDKALEMLLEIEASNTDGVGSVHLSENGEFVVNKYPTSLSKVMEKGTPFLHHMANGDFNGWTLTHLRAASHGAVAMKNTHPFIIDNKWGFVHNGVWSDYDVVKLALSKTIKFEGETDTEVAGHLFSIAGPKAFCETINSAGVFCGLRKDGALFIVKTSGSLEFNELPNKTIVAASDIKRAEYPQAELIQSGWYYFNKSGKLIKSSKKTTVFTNSYNNAGGKFLPSSNVGSTPAHMLDEEYVSEWRHEMQ